MERTEEVVAIATSHRVLETMSSQFAIRFPEEPVTNCDQFISCQVILDNCRNLRQQVLMFYADFAYYFDLAVHFQVLRHHPKLFPLNPLPKKHKNTDTPLQMCKKMRDLAGFV